MMTNTKL